MNVFFQKNAQCALIGAAAISLAACASAPSVPSLQKAEQDSQLRAAQAWQALPQEARAQNAHAGDLSKLRQWWAQAGDPALDALMQAAQAESASLAAARTRIFQARAAQADAQVATLPSLSANVQASRAVRFAGSPPISSVSAGLQSAWEIDLWGGAQAALQASQLRAQGAQLGWHEARVAVAAEVAANYLNFRHCEMQGALLKNDLASRQESARLIELSARAGFAANTQAQLAAASRLEASQNLLAAQANCQLMIKSLVALSGVAEPDLSALLQTKKDAGQTIIDLVDAFSIADHIPALPAALLMQRPDIAAAQTAVTIAALDAQNANSKRYPSLSLSGSINPGRISQMGVSAQGNTWSLGPVALTMPLSNASQIKAHTEAQVAAYDEAVLNLKAKVRQAVREVEEGLVNLASLKLRSAEAQSAAAAFASNLRATQERQRTGLASLIEVEEAKRSALLAQQSQLSIARERVLAWITLYRSLGGGWNAQDAMPLTAAQASSSK